MLSAAHPFSTRSAASGRPSERSYAAFQNPPWITTTTPRGEPDRQGQLANWLGSSPYRIVCVAVATGSSSPLHDAVGENRRTQTRKPEQGAASHDPDEPQSAWMMVQDLAPGAATLGAEAPLQVMPTRPVCAAPVS